MAYCIKNQILKSKVYYFPEWAIVGPGYICIRSEFAQKEKIKTCKNPETVDTSIVEKVYNKLPEIVARVSDSPKIEKSIFTHDGPEMWDDSYFVWRIQVDKDKIYEFDAEQVGWILHRLRGKRLKWHLIPWINSQGILVFTNAFDSKDAYAMITCSYSSEREKLMNAVGR